MRIDRPGEPTETDVEALADRLRHETGVLIAVGGGSTIDVVKAARATVQLGVPYGELLASGPAIPPAAVPLIAVPTTAGTGSEVSGGAVTTMAHGRKAGIASPNLRAQVALVDPVLTWSCPPAQTRATGVDALAQAIAGMVVTAGTPIGDALALEAIRLIADALPAAYADGSDRGARSALACGSLMAGLTINVSDCGAEYSIGQAIGTRLGASHVRR